MESWINEFENKKIVIWGFGREGLSSYTFIRSLLPNSLIYIADGNTSFKNIQRIKDLTTNIELIDEDMIDSSFDVILKSPGIVLKGKQKDLEVTSEAQLFLKHYKNQTIGITGTKGKSTTSSLIYAALQTTCKTVLVGNIGIPCFDCIQDMEEGAIAVFEISCHQLEYATTSPHIGVFLNLFEEHLDHYGSFEAYGNAKANIFRNMDASDMILIHKDLDAYCKEIAHPILIGRDITTKDSTLIIPNHSLTIEECALIGKHNLCNMAVAYMVSKQFGVSDENFKKAMKEFKPLSHRLENLGVIDGITYVDDSISTIGQSCIQALVSLPNTTTVLVGGMDRGIEYNELEAYLSKRNDLNVIFMYSSGERVYNELKEKHLLHDRMTLVNDLQEAMFLAKKISPKGSLVLLSPAASSYDHFKNFEERGDVFRELAKKC